MGIFSIFNGKKKRAEVVSSLITMAYMNNGKYETEDVYYEAIEKFVKENNGKILNKNSSYIILDEDRIDFFNIYADVIQVTIVNNEEYTQDIHDEVTGQGKYKQVTDYEYILNSINSFDDRPTLRLKFKNIGQALQPLWDNNIETSNIDDIDHFIINNQVYGLYVSENIYIDIIDFSNENELKTIEWLNKQKLLIQERNKKIMENITR